MNCEIAMFSKKYDGPCSRTFSTMSLLTYLRLGLDGIVVQSTAALSLTIEQHSPLIHHFHGRDLILIREMTAKEIK
jgi:hypothetical protein